MQLRPWLPHLALLGLMAVQAAVWAGSQRSEAELEQLLASGEPLQRAWALHVLTNRGEVDPDRWSAQFTRELLESDEPDELREMMFMNDMAKMRPPLIQGAYFDDFRGKQLDHFTRSWMLHHRKVGGPIVGAGVKMQLKELEWILESLSPEGLQLEEGEMWDHMTGRADVVGTRKGRRGEDEDAESRDQAEQDD